MKNNLLNRMQTVERVTRQYDVDTLQIALSRYAKVSFGFKRINEIVELWMSVQQEYKQALTTSIEADVAQAHIDAELTEIIKGQTDLIPFGTRYHELRKPK